MTKLTFFLLCLPKNKNKKKFVVSSPELPATVSAYEKRMALSFY
jgi:hypothetical protein